MLFRWEIAVYCGSPTKPIDTQCGQMQFLILRVVVRTKEGVLQVEIQSHVGMNKKSVTEMCRRRALLVFIYHFL